MKILKKALKITGIILVSIILFLILLLGGAKLFESELASIALDELGSEINAPMSIGKVSLIPLFSFPRLSAEINNLWIGDPKSKHGDTLLFISSLKLGLDTWDLMDGIYTIDKMEISGLDFDYTIDKSGNSNIDFLLNAFGDTTAHTDTIPVNIEEEVGAALELTAEKLKLENIRIKYYDSLSNIGSQVYIPEITLKAKTKNNISKAKTEGSFVLSHLIFEETRIDQMESLTVIFDVEYENDDAIINKLLVISEGLDLAMEGRFKVSDTLYVDARVEAKTLDFDILKKYIPNEYAHLFEGANLGKMLLSTIDLEMDYAGNDASIKKFSVKSKGIDLGLEGTFGLSDTIAVDAYLNAKTLDFDVLKGFIPNQYMLEYGIIDIGGKADVFASIKGKYADSTLLPQVDAKVNFKNIRLQTVDYPIINRLNFEAQLTNGKAVDMSEAAVDITTLEVFTPKSSVYLTGSFHGLDEIQYDFNTDLNINLPEFKNFIPDSLAKNPQGNLTASITSSGILPQIIPDDFADKVLDKSTLSLKFIDISGLFIDSLQIDNFSAVCTYSPQSDGGKRFHIYDLSLRSEELGFNIQNTSATAVLTGKLAEPLKMAVDVESFRLQNGNNLVTGTANIKDFESPEFDVNTNIMLDLEELVAMAPDSTINHMSGTVKGNMHIIGKVHPDSIDTQLYPILFENSSFYFRCKDVTLLFPDSLMNIHNVSAQISLENDELKLNDFYALYNGLSLEVDSTIVKNMYKAVLLNQKEELYVKTKIKIGDVIYDDFKHWMETGTSTDVNVAWVDTANTDEVQNWTFLIHGSASVNSFIIDSTVLEGYKINRLYLQDVSTLFKLMDSSYIFDQFKFKAFEGEMNNSFHYREREDGTESVSSHHVVQNMNIRTLLRDMDNFGMDSLITYENISGLLSMDLNMFVPIDDSVLIDKMMISGDLVLAEGGVYDYGPAEEVSKFTRIKELDNIQFKTLRSSIFMFKNKIYVPRTMIVSNALDIAAFGMQSLDYDYQYHLEIHLSNILFGKSKKRIKKQSDSGDEIDEASLKKSSHKIRYADVEGETKVGLDSKAAREEMMNRIRVQKKMLDFIFFPKNIHYNTDVPEKK